jgi:hypothetical protein
MLQFALRRGLSRLKPRKHLVNCRWIKSL